MMRRCARVKAGDGVLAHEHADEEEVSARTEIAVLGRY